MEIDVNQVADMINQKHDVLNDVVNLKISDKNPLSTHDFQLEDIDEEVHANLIKRCTYHQSVLLLSKG